MKKLFYVAFAVCIMFIISTRSVEAADSTKTNDQSVSAEKAKLLKRLFDDMKLDALMKQLSVTMTEQMKSQLPALMNKEMAGSEMTDEQKKYFNDEFMPVYMDKIYKAIFSILNLNEMVDKIYIPIYAKHYDEDDIKALIAFYESPTGKKFVDTMPAITDEAMKQFMKDYMPKMMDTIKNISDEMTQDLKKKFGDGDK